MRSASSLAVHLPLAAVTAQRHSVGASTSKYKTHSVCATGVIMYLKIDVFVYFVCACVWMHMCQDVSVEVRRKVSPLLPLCGPRGLNPSHQAWQEGHEGPLLTELHVYFAEQPYRVDAACIHRPREAQAPHPRVAQQELEASRCAPLISHSVSDPAVTMEEIMHPKACCVPTLHQALFWLQGTQQRTEQISIFTSWSPHSSWRDLGQSCK